MRMLVVVALLLVLLSGCDAEGGWFGFRSLSKRDASRIDGAETVRR